MITKASHWRQMLREYVEKNPEEKKRIARFLPASVRSIDRWIEPGSTIHPKPHVIPRLATAIPVREAEMRLSLEHDYPDAFELAAGIDVMSNIPGPFHERIFEAKATLAYHIARPAIMGSVGKQLCIHLDPDGKGLMVLFAQCVKPMGDGKVNSLFVHVTGYGTKQWQYQQVDGAYHLGRDSLCAVAIAEGRIALYPGDVVRIHPAPLLYPEEIKSCAAYPVLREGDIAGALFLVATDREFFNGARRELIVKYSHLFANALRDHEFYPIRRIELLPMPTPTQQSEIYGYAQQILEHLAQQYPDEETEQLEQRGRDIFHEQCNYIRKETSRGKQ